MKITFLGHACFLIETGGKRLLFDPFISPNSLVQEIRTASVDPALVANLNPDQIECDYVLLSHGHEDHVADAISILKRTGAKAVSNFEIISWLGNQGIENGHPMNLGGQWNFDFGNVKSVNAVHSSVLPDGTYGGNPGGFVISNDEGILYYAGDTALTLDMQLIGDRHRPDIAILPIGDNFTMGVDDAIEAARFVQCNKIIGMHYDTFGFIKIDHEEAKQKFSEAGMELLLPGIGETIEI